MAIPNRLKEQETQLRLKSLDSQFYGTAEVAGELGLDANVLRVRLSRLRRRLRSSGVLTDWL